MGSGFFSSAGLAAFSSSAARTRKATRDCFWDLAESFLVTAARAARAGVAQVKEAMTAC